MVLLSMQRNETLLERFVIVVLMQVRIFRVMRIARMRVETRFMHEQSPPAGSCRHTGAGRPR
ncbi:hypothetical protein AQ846_14565 [Burkholderia pseudomallei]|nr:hypothetical protein WJ08_18350 [Burkholderia vietnamiensis]KVF42817.1 hypothetical protein WJ10_11860 [Burkholderia vietnamiensis]OAB14659.1 hypothetical protein AQ846_14565 [Burkholderia pseudomallei]OMR27336.1 hypothetical protein AQ722_13090 [Burkholderia pseudomallei]OMU92146.1 hypothetical protein AQ783_25470 [Burkholderia pseudomallei]